MLIIVNYQRQSYFGNRDHGAIFANHDAPAASVAGTFGGLDITWRPNGPEFSRLHKIVVHDIMSKRGLGPCYALRRREIRRMDEEIHRDHSLILMNKFG